MRQNNMKKVIRLTESDLNHIIGMVLNEVNESNNTITLYHCFNDEPKTRMGIWLSDGTDDAYGKKIAEFEIPLSEFNIATDEQVINYIKKYDIRKFEDIMEDEFASGWLDDYIEELYDAWDEYEKTGKVSNSSELIEKIPYMSWAEIMEHPYYYNFLKKLKSDGFDGYTFRYYDMGYNNYYYFFDPQKVMQYRVK